MEDDIDDAARLSEDSLAAMADVMHQTEEPQNASPGISIDNSQSPTTPVLSTASAMPPDNDGVSLPEAQEDDPADVASHLYHSLCHVLFASDLRWIIAQDIDACAGATAPHDWAIMLPVSRRVQPAVYTAMALSRYRDALLQVSPRAAPRVYPALPVDILTNASDILLLPPRAFRTDRPRPEDAHYALSTFLHFRYLFPDITQDHRGRESLLLSPRLDAQNPFLGCLQTLAVVILHILASLTN